MPARAGRGPSDHARPAPRDAAASRPRRARRRADRSHGRRLPAGREAREALPSLEANIRRKRCRCQVRFLTSAESAAVWILHAVVTMRANRLPVGSGLILLATRCFVFPLRSEKRAPPFGALGGRHGPRWRGARGRRELSTPRRRGHGPPSMTLATSPRSPTSRP